MEISSNEPSTLPLLAVPEQLPAHKCGLPWLAWPIILATVGFIVYRGATGATHEHITDEGKPAVSAIMDLQARYLVGLQKLFPSSSLPGYDPAVQLKQFDSGPPSQRLRYAILVGDMVSPKAALDYVKGLDQRVETEHLHLTPTESRDLELLSRLYAGYAAGKPYGPALEPAQQDELRQDLGWYGELALAPPGGPNAGAREAVLQSAQQTAMAMVAVTAVGFLLFALGGVGLLLFLVFAALGRIRGGVAYGSPTGGLYAETFAVWLLLFLGLSVLASAVDVGGDDLAIGRAGVAMLLSLVALAWPVLRGVRWRQVRQEVGWTRGRRPWLEPFCGLACYIMSWPLVFIGLLVVLLLVLAQHAFTGGAGSQLDSSPMPVHPAAGLAVQGTWWVRAQLLLIAAIVAPIVEETMFRGVLYRHLREASLWTGRIVSVLLSTTVAGFIFGVLHPTGWLAVPMLMAIAYGLAMAREWRGTLIPGMVAHGVNNALVMTILILLAGT